jgi:uncharacterized protein
MAAKTTRKQIDDFLALKRIAFIGISSNPKALSRGLWHELEDRRYDVVPVARDGAIELDGKQCYGKVQDVQAPVQGALIIGKPEAMEQALRDCAEAGITNVWLYKGMGSPRISAAALAFCKDHGMTAVAGECPYMFLAGTPFFHGLHGFGKKITGGYPA